MVSQAVVPWYSQEEFNEVREKVFSKEIQDLEWAAARLSAWRCRRPKAFSGMIATTYALVHAEIAYQHMSDSMISVNEDVTCLYRSALMLFVSDVVEPVSRDLEYPKKLIMNHIGLPIWIIDARNGIAHNEGESLDLMRSCCAVIQQWLKTVYWYSKNNNDSFKSIVAYIKAGSDAEKMSISGPDESLLVEQYYDAFMAYDEYHSGPNNQRLVLVSQKLDFIKTRNPTAFIENIVTSPKGIMTTLLQDAGEVSAHQDCLNDTLRRMWLPFLHSLGEALNDLIVKMLTYSDRTDHWNRRVAVWIIHFVKVGVFRQLEYRLHLKPVELLTMAMREPNRYTLEIMNALIEIIKPSPTAEQSRCLRELFTIYTGGTIKRGSGGSGDSLNFQRSLKSIGLFTVNDMNKQCVSSVGSASWQLAPEQLAWSTTPLGMTPGMISTDHKEFEMDVGDLQPVCDNKSDDGRLPEEVTGSEGINEEADDDDYDDNGDDAIQRIGGYFMNALPAVVSLSTQNYQY